jgi:hypothetical protein
LVTINRIDLFRDGANESKGISSSSPDDQGHAGYGLLVIGEVALRFRYAFVPEVADVSDDAHDLSVEVFVT